MDQLANKLLEGFIHVASSFTTSFVALAAGVVLPMHYHMVKLLVEL